MLLGHWLEEVEKVPRLEAGVGLEMEARDRLQEEEEHPMAVVGTRVEGEGN